MQAESQAWGYRLPSAATKILVKKRVLIVIAPKNFHDDEFSIPFNMLKKAGVGVTVASTTTSTAIGMLGLKVTPDLSLKDVEIDKYDALVLVGGTGIVENSLPEDKVLLNIIKKAAFGGKVIAAICLAPRILAKAGVLRGKILTVWRDMDSVEIVENAGGTYIREPVVVDGNLITADGPSSARRFAESIIDVLTR